jgi:hypothetical protein
MISKLAKILERYPRFYQIAIRIYGLRAFHPARLHYRIGCLCNSTTEISGKYELIFDAQCLQGLTRQRGIGTYSLSLIDSICSLEPNKKFAAYLTTIAKCTDIEIAKKELESLNCTNLDVIVIDPFKDAFTRSLDFLQQEIALILSKANPLAIVNLSNFEKPKNAIPTPMLPQCKRIGVLYDLIPMQFSGDFLVSNAQKSTYSWQIEQLNNSDLLLSISESSMTKWRELVNAESKVKVIHGGGRKNSEPNQKDFMQRFGILCVSAEQSHKNLTRLLEAYSLLDAQIQKLEPLTIVGIRSVGTRKRLKAQANKLRIQLQLPEYLSVEQLTNLYKTKRLLVIPSLEEGLSLPILEAWSQGLPAVASSNTAMEEILVDSYLLFNPYSVDSIKETMSRILSQNSLWQKAVEEIPAKISRFSWNQTAKLALDAIKEA